MDSIPHDKLDGRQFACDERLEVWRQSVEPLFDCRPAREAAGEDFLGRLESFNLGQTLIARSAFTPLHFQRDRRTSDDHLLVQLYTHGGYQGYNGDRKVRVGPGDISLLDMGLGLETLAPSSANLSLVIPRDSFFALTKPADYRPGTVLRAGTPLATIIANHLSAVWDTLADASAEEVPAINRALVARWPGRSLRDRYAKKPACPSKTPPAMRCAPSSFTTWKTRAWARCGCAAVSACREAGCTGCSSRLAVSPAISVSSDWTGHSANSPSATVGSGGWWKWRWSAASTARATFAGCSGSVSA